MSDVKVYKTTVTNSFMSQMKLQKVTHEFEADLNDFSKADLPKATSSLEIVLKSDFDKLAEALKYVCRVTYGTEAINSDAENNEILARHFFNSQEKALSVLKELGIEV